jgi:hypothetical protein
MSKETELGGMSETLDCGMETEVRTISLSVYEMLPIGVLALPEISGMDRELKSCSNTSIPTSFK